MTGFRPSPGATTPQPVNMMNEALGRQVAGSSLCEVVPEHMVELADSEHQQGHLTLSW